MRVLFVCRKFDAVAGGVERMAATLMNALSARGHDIHLLTWDQRVEATCFYPLDPRIVWHKLAMGDPAKKAGWGVRWRRAKKVRALLKTLRPDVVLAFQDGPFTAIRLFGLGLSIPMIAAERNAPFRHERIKSFPPFALSCQIMRLAAAITVQFERYRSGYPRFLHSRIVVVPNHVFPAKTPADPGAPDARTKTLLAVGRLSSEKNFPALIHAFSRLAADFPDWRLKIVGEGARRAELEALVARFPPDARSAITMPGASADVPSHLKEAHLFCLPSLWEGFPNALAEAMVHGLPCVGFAACPGVCDLIEDRRTGLLAPGDFSAQALADTLREAMGDAALRTRLGEAARAAMEAYVPDKVFDLWETLLRNVARL